MNWNYETEYKEQLVEDLQMKYLVYGSHVWSRYSVILYKIINWFTPPESCICS